MKLRSPSKYLIIALFSIFSVSCLFIILNKTFGLETHFEKHEEQDSQDYKFRLPGIVISYVNRLYVDPERIDNVEMIKGALSWEERIIPEVLTDYSEENKTQIVTVGDVSKAFNLSSLHRPKDMFNVIQETLEFINQNRETNETITVNDIEYTAINGMLTQLDPHSIILPPKQFDEFKIGTMGKFGGLGMVVGIRDGILTVISPIEGTPAARTGLEAGDKIIEVDGESTVNMTLTESVGKLRGDPGTNVTLSVIRGNASQPQAITLTREIIAIPTVESASLDAGLGYIKIRNFQDDTFQCLSEHLKRLATVSDGLKGLIIDLRNNSGGLLDQAIKVSDKFLSEGTIVVTVGPGGNPREIVEARKSETDEEFYPIVVLVSAGSASGAEIVAGALKENDRAVIVGDRTFGKGSVQQLIELMDGSALKLTIAKYLTPLFTDIQSFGITPDIQVNPVTITEEDINLFRGNVAIREEDLKKHLDEHHKDETPFATLKYFHKTKEKDKLKDSKEEKEEEPEETEDPYKLPDFDTDFHVIFAKKLLENTSTWEKELFLKDSLPIFGETRKLEEAKFVEALKKLDIDWTTGPSTGTATTKLSFSTEPKNRRVKAGEKITLTINVTNTGNTPIYQLRGISSSENGLFDKLEFILGKIDKGNSNSYSKTIEIPKAALDREDEVTIQFEELNQNNPEEIKFNLITEALERPNFAFSYQILDRATETNKNDEDGLIRKGENIELLVTVKNTGKGTAEKTVVTLKELSDKEVYIDTGRAELGQLEPGEIKTAILTFFVKETMASEQFTMDMIISDIVFGSFLSNKLTFPIVAGANKLEKNSVSVEIDRNHTPLYGGMSFESPVISILEEGAILASDANNTDWYRILLDDNRFGWVAAKDIAVLNDSKKMPSEIKPFIQRIPPRITLDNSSSNQLFGGEILTLSTKITDDVCVKHAYVLINNDKVFFKSNKYSTPRTRSKLKINTTLPLKEGPNVVTIVARDDQDLVTIRSFIATRNITVAKGPEEDEIY